MRPSIIMKPLSLLAAGLSVLPAASAQRLIESNSLVSCQADSQITASVFKIAFTPDNASLALTLAGYTQISEPVMISIFITAYGYSVYNTNLDPCDPDSILKNLCNPKAGPLPSLTSSLDVGKSAADQVPSIAYSVPDLDGLATIYFNSTKSGQTLACLEAPLSNGQTVYQPAVGWVTAVIAGLGLVASAITSGLGHSNTAAHVAANALSLFGYFQAQAQYGMVAVEQPPIVASWTQNFQWSMGIIRVGFLQDMATWYQRSTGGTPSQLLSVLSDTSVEIQKRSLDIARSVMGAAVKMMKRAPLTARATTTDSGIIVVRGIERVGFRASIESTNIFMTGYAFFLIFVIFVVVGVVAFKYICEALVKSGKMKGDKFQDFRNGWLTVLKGVLYRIVLIGFPQMVVLCFWEMTKRDSAGEVVLAVFTIITMISILAWASSKVIRVAQRSITMHKNPAYILYSDPVSLNKWGFLYVQFKATAYFFVVPLLGYALVKGMFIALGQDNGTVQAVALVLLEAGLLVAVSVLRPYMDKKTNGFNIAIAAINFLSAIFMLVFSEVFNQPDIVTGVMGVAFFIFNAAFALILLIMVLVSSGYALFSKNPDTRYQPMRDDRGSFIKSQTQLTTELDALGATARGDKGTGNPFGGNTSYQGSRLGDEESDAGSYSSHPSGAHKEAAAAGLPAPGSHSAPGSRGGYGDQPPRSPVDPSVPFFPSAGSDGRHGPPSFRSAGTSSPAPSGGNGGMWQRGAGYEH